MTKNHKGGAALVVGGEGVRAAVTRDATCVAVHFDVRGGRVDRRARAEIVAQVFALPALRESWHLRAAVPLGDSELLEELRRRCQSLSVRAAGATCLVDAELSPRGMR